MIKEEDYASKLYSMPMGLKRDSDHNRTRVLLKTMDYIDILAEKNYTRVDIYNQLLEDGKIPNDMTYVSFQAAYYRAKKRM